MSAEQVLNQDSGRVIGHIQPGANDAGTIIGSLNALGLTVMKHVMSVTGPLPDIRFFRGWSSQGAIVTQGKINGAVLYEVFTPDTTVGTRVGSAVDQVPEVYISPLLTDPRDVALALYAAILSVKYPAKMVAKIDEATNQPTGKLRKVLKSNEWKDKAKELGLDHKKAPKALGATGTLEFIIAQHIERVVLETGKCEFPKLDAYKLMVQTSRNKGTRYKVECPKGVTDENGVKMTENTHMVFMATERFRDVFDAGKYPCHVCGTALGMEPKEKIKAEVEASPETTEAQAQPEPKGEAKAKGKGKKNTTVINN